MEHCLCFARDWHPLQGWDTGLGVCGVCGARPCLIEAKAQPAPSHMHLKCFEPGILLVSEHLCIESHTDTTVLIGLLFNHLLIFKCGFTSLPMVCSPTSELHSYKLNIHKVYSSLVFSCCISCLNKVTYWKTSHWAGVCWRSFSMHTSLPFSKNLF